YFAHDWDAAYAALLETHDPGEPPLQGGLLVARLGRGTYVYTGLSFFRQLPAAVPGAYRLFANLLALHKRDAPSPRTPLAGGSGPSQCEAHAWVAPHCISRLPPRLAVLATLR